MNETFKEVNAEQKDVTYSAASGRTSKYRDIRLVVRMKTKAEKLDWLLREMFGDGKKK